MQCVEGEEKKKVMAQMEDFGGVLVSVEEQSGPLFPSLSMAQSAVLYLVDGQEW